jgi:hypothetical protein
MAHSGFQFCSCLLILGCTLTLSGCSVLGYITGKEADPGEPGRPIHFPEQLSRLRPGTRIFVLKKDGTMIQGAFVGMGQVEDTILSTKYRDEFGRWRLHQGTNASPLPPFGATVSVHVLIANRHERYDGEFAGFDARSIRLQTRSGRGLIRPKLEFVENMCDSIGNVIASGEALRQTVKEGVPLGDRLEMRPGFFILANNSKVGITLDHLESVNLWEESGTTSSTGYVLGLLADLGIAVGVTLLILSSL